MCGLVCQAMSSPKMNSESVVYCVGSPLQLLCAIEAKARMGSAVNVLVVREPSPDRREHISQMRGLLKEEEWSAIHFWPFSRLSGNAGLLLAARQASRIACRIPEKCSTYVLGGFGQLRGQLLRSELNPNSMVVIDDGTSTLKHLALYYSQGKNMPDFVEDMLKGRGLGSVFKRLALGLNEKALDCQVQLFTGFDIVSEQSGSLDVIRHRFDELKSRRIEQRICGQSVFYFGSPFTERQILDVDVELSVVESVSKHYRERGFDFVYISHRDDSEEKMELLKHSGVVIRSLGMPAELYFATSEDIPGNIASTISTALFNVSCIVDGLKAEAFPIFELLPAERKLAHKRVVQQYLRAGIRIRELFGVVDFASSNS